MTDLQPGGLRTLIEMRGSVPGGNEVAAWVKRQPSCCSRVARCRRTRVTAPKKSQTMPSRTTSAQSRHTATGWPSRSTTIDTTSQVPKSMPSHSGDSLAAGAVTGQRLLQSRRKPALFVVRHVHPLYDSKRIHQHAAAQTNEGARAGHPFPGWGGDGHGGPALAAQPKPSDARSILTKMLVSMAFAIWFMLSMLRECIAAVWWQPPSSCTAGRWPLQRSPPAPPAAPASSVQ